MHKLQQRAARTTCQVRQPRWFEPTARCLSASSFFLGWRPAGLRIPSHAPPPPAHPGPLLPAPRHRRHRDGLVEGPPPAHVGGHRPGGHLRLLPRARPARHAPGRRQAQQAHLRASWAAQTCVCVCVGVCWCVCWCVCVCVSVGV